MNYYNDNDKFASKWLRELIKDGLIPEGYVDDRSIEAVTPKDLDGYDQCHFFAGIGGWPRALELAGWDSTRPVWTASLPCQPFSCAGQQQGEKDERHLWPVFFSLVKKCRPPIIFGEQVASKDGREWLAGIQTDLETLGYSCAAADLPAASVCAPHKRNRLFWVAQSIGVRQKGSIRAELPSVSGRECEPISRSSTSPTGRVADSKGDHGWSGERREKTGTGQNGVGRRGSASGSFWSNSLLIPCADGKYRRVPGRWVADPELHGHPTTERGRSVGAKQEKGGLLKSERTRSVNFWQDSILIPCADGKYRRVPGYDIANACGSGQAKQKLEIEPLLFPLADGIPNRVGILRGAGNAIVPQVAAEFIKAVEQLI